MGFVNHGGPLWLELIHPSGIGILFCLKKFQNKDFIYDKGNTGKF